MISSALAWLGIDVSKLKLDVSLLRENRQRAKTFQNTPDGWQDLVAWLTALGIEQVHVCLEATGRYGEGVALALHRAGHVVSIANPAQIKDFTRSTLTRNKSDAVDAKAIREFCRLSRPASWTPPSQAEQALRDLVRTRDGLIAAKVEWSNRRQDGALCAMADEAMVRIIEMLEEERRAIEAAIAETIAGDTELAQQYGLLLSVPGVGRTLATVVLTELPTPSAFKTVKQVAAYAGLTPSDYRSGSSVKHSSRISRIGNATLRAALYMPALTAMRFNPLVKSLVDRLRMQARLEGKQIVVAAMRKLLCLCYGVLKTGKPFDLDHCAAWTQAALTSPG
jgi:transposase